MRNGRFGDKYTEDTFVSRMSTFIEDRRQKIHQDLKEQEGAKKNPIITKLIQKKCNFQSIKLMK